VFMSTFSLWLREALDERALPVRRLAAIADVSPSTAHAWVSGKHHPEPIHVRKIGEALKLPWEEVARRAGYHSEDAPHREALPPEVEEVVRIALELDERGRQSLREAARGLLLLHRSRE
jgi:transcriptional regulator with XRE-family HTH domain